MRQIGNLSNETQARVFSDFLVSNGVRNQVEHDGSGSWSVWVVEEDRISAARTWLEQFRANPNGQEFRNVQSEAEKVRKAEAQDLANYHQRIRTRRSLFPKFGGYGIGILTYVLILLCVIVALYSSFGENEDVLRHLFISDPESGVDGLLPEVFAGEVWRLFTPIFIHFGLLHLLFNMMWLFQLGCMIEARQTTWLLAVLVAVTALFSNVAQLLISHDPGFGGMSGVVYGLAGYVWIRGKYDPKSGVFLDQQSVTILLVWLVICYAGYVGPVADTAHLAGLITGAVWGGVSAFFGTRKPE